MAINGARLFAPYERAAILKTEWLRMVISIERINTAKDVIDLTNKLSGCFNLIIITPKGATVTKSSGSGVAIIHFIMREKVSSLKELSAPITDWPNRQGMNGAAEGISVPSIRKVVRLTPFQ